VRLWVKYISELSCSKEIDFKFYQLQNESCEAAAAILTLNSVPESEALFNWPNMSDVSKVFEIDDTCTFWYIITA
jgi:hypothetical protein